MNDVARDGGRGKMLNKKRRMEVKKKFVSSSYVVNSKSLMCSGPGDQIIAAPELAHEITILAARSFNKLSR